MHGAACVYEMFVAAGRWEANSNPHSGDASTPFHTQRFLRPPSLSVGGGENPRSRTVPYMRFRSLSAVQRRSRVDGNTPSPSSMLLHKTYEHTRFSSHHQGSPTNPTLIFPSSSFPSAQFHGLHHTVAESHRARVFSPSVPICLDNVHGVHVDHAPFIAPTRPRVRNSKRRISASVDGHTRHWHHQDIPSRAVPIEGW